MIKDIVYRLKHQKPTHVDVYESIITTDRLTGNKTSIINKASIDKGIVLASKFARKFEQNSPNFQMGGFFDINDRELIIDKIDLPVGWKLNLNQYIIIKNKRYEIKNIFDFIDDSAYILVIRETIGQKIVQIKDTISILLMDQNAQQELA